MGEEDKQEEEEEERGAGALSSDGHTLFLINKPPRGFQSNFPHLKPMLPSPIQGHFYFEHKGKAFSSAIPHLETYLPPPSMRNIKCKTRAVHS